MMTARVKSSVRMSLWLLAAAFGVNSAFGWGGGHDVVAQLYGQYMPPELKQFLGEWQGRLDWWCHYPDMTNFGWGSRRYMKEEDLRRNTFSFRSSSRRRKRSIGRTCGLIPLARVSGGRRYSG